MAVEVKINEKLKFKCIYVTGLEQSLHFKQAFKAVEMMGYDWADTLIHVPYGLVSLDGEKLSARNGNIIYAEDILKESIRRAWALTELTQRVLCDGCGLLGVDGPGEM